MSTKFSISVIIPVYNVDRYLVECLDSVFNQTYKNFDVIAIDDGSTDGSSLILNTYKQQYSNINVVTQRNQGLSAARNTGIDCSNGDFIIFLDSDDRLHPDALLMCNNYINRFNVDIILFSGFAFADGIPDEKIINMNYNRPVQLLNKPMCTNLLFNYFIEKNEYIVSACFYIFSREILNNLRFMPGIYHEDNLFTTLLLLNSSNFRGVCVPDQLYERRVRADSITTKKKNFKHIAGYKAVADSLLEFNLNDSNYNDKLNIFIQKTYFTCSILLNYVGLSYSSLNIYKSIMFSFFFRTRLSINFVKYSLFVLFPFFIPVVKYLKTVKFKKTH